MEIRQLKYFIKVAETLNFSEASRELFITQSTLSQQVSKLEQELGQQLFERNSHEVVLTEAGRELQKYALVTINSVNDCMQHMEDLKNMFTGELNIGVTFSFSSIVDEALLSFLKKYPGVKLDVFYKTMEELMDMLLRRELDIVLAFKPTKKDERIDSRLLFNNYLAVIVKESHALASLKSISLQELQKYPLVLPARGLQSRNLLDNILADKEINLKVNVEMNNVNHLLEIVRNSNYITILSESTIIHENGLKALRLNCDKNDMEGCIHILRDTYIKKSAKEFINILCESSSVLNMSLGYLLNNR